MTKNEILIKIKNIIEDYRNSNYPDYINCVDDIEDVINKELK